MLIPKPYGNRKSQRQIIFLVTLPREGEVTPAANPNGSVDNIAGVCNEKVKMSWKDALSEIKASEALLGSADGKLIFTSTLEILGGMPIMKEQDWRRGSGFN